MQIRQETGKSRTEEVHLSFYTLSAQKLFSAETLSKAEYLPSLDDSRVHCKEYRHSDTYASL